MHAVVDRHRAAIASLCRQFQVRRLEVFGSATRGGSFCPERSDVDFLVEYDPKAPAPTLAEFFELKDRLAGVIGRPVDLVVASTVTNPFVRAEIERSREPVYGA